MVRLTPSFAVFALAGLAASWSTPQAAPGQTSVTVTVNQSPGQCQILMPCLPRRDWQSRVSPVEISDVHASISIDGQIATTVLELTISNPGHTQQEAKLVLPVADGVVVRSLQYDGVGTDIAAEVLRKEDARRIYDGIVNSMKDPALVEFVGYNLVQTSAFPIAPGKSQKLSLTLEQVLTADGNRIDYVLPRSESLAQSKAWTIDTKITAKTPIGTVFSPSHDVSIERPNPNAGPYANPHASPNAAPTTIRVNNTARDQGAFRLSYMLEDETAQGLTATVFAYPDASAGGGDGKGGYFMLLGSLNDSKAISTPTKREVVLVFDRSGSMRGEKFSQAKAAAEQVLAGLDEGEAFNIIDYSDSISSFADKPVVKSRETLAAAKRYLASLESNGGTNINDALLEAMRANPVSGMMPMVLFLTDGIPTVGERAEVAIREAVKTANAHERRIFTFGVGVDVNVPLLATLAESSRGATTIIMPNEDVEVQVSRVFRRLKGPVLGFPSFGIVGSDMGTRRLANLMPKSMPDVFEGDQILVFGEYRGDTPMVLKLSGQAVTGNTGDTREYQVRFDPANASVRNGFVPRLWASRKVTTLIDEVRQAGAKGVAATDPEMKEIIDEIVRLSTKYGILTEYTAFLATDQPNLADAAGQAAARNDVMASLQERAVECRTGAGSVNQQRDMDAKQAAVNAPRSAWYFDKEMKKVEIDTVMNIANCTLYFRNNRWVDSRLLAKEGEKPARTIVLGTPEFTELAHRLATRGEQASLSFSEDALLEIDGEAVLIKQK